MGLPRLSGNYLFELGPDLKVNGRPAPCAVLGSLLAGASCKPYLIGHRRALLLCALSLQCAMLGLKDEEAPPGMPAPRDWRRGIRSPRMQVPAHQLAWSPTPERKPSLFPHLTAYLAQLSHEFVRDVVAWAPPVVVRDASLDTWRVVANGMSALVARFRLGDTAIKVRPLVVESSTLPRTLTEVLQLNAEAMWPLYGRHRRDIACATARLDDAIHLTGYGRAWVAHLRQHAR